jgi:voltage-gated sodium channel
MAELSRRLVESRWFQHVVLGLIVLNAALMGMETWPELAARHGSSFRVMNGAVQAAFVVELALRLSAHGRRPDRFFRNGWNVFDFTVVALSLLPAAGPFATVARLARILRVGRLVSGMPELRLIIGTMLRSIPSMGHVVTLLALLIYVYGVTGHHLFGEVDPEHWGTLGRAAQTLFFVITLEGWIEIMQASAPATPWALVYYASFIIIAVFVVTNLFIAVVINNLEKVRSEEEPPRGNVRPRAGSARLRLRPSRLRPRPPASDRG